MLFPLEVIYVNGACICKIPQFPLDKFGSEDEKATDKIISSQFEISKYIVTKFKTTLNNFFHFEFISNFFPIPYLINTTQTSSQKLLMFENSSTLTRILDLYRSTWNKKRKRFYDQHFWRYFRYFRFPRIRMWAVHKWRHILGARGIKDFVTTVLKL